MRRIAGVSLFFSGLLVGFMALSLASTNRPQLAWLAAASGAIVAIAGLAVLALADRSEAPGGD